MVLPQNQKLPAENKTVQVNPNPPAPKPKTGLNLSAPQPTANPMPEMVSKNPLPSNVGVPNPSNLGGNRENIEENEAYKRLQELQIDPAHIGITTIQTDLVSIADVKMNIVFANDIFCNVSGYSREELIGKNHRIVRSQKHDKKFWEDFYLTIMQGSVWRGVIQNKNKSGEYYWVDTTAKKIYDRNGKVYYLAIRHLITDLIKKEEALQKALHENKKLIQQERQTVQAVRSENLLMKQEEGKQNITKQGLAIVTYIALMIFIFSIFLVFFSPDTDASEGFRNLMGLLITGVFAFLGGSATERSKIRTNDSK